MTVSPNTYYNVHIEVMGNDLNSDYEYIDVYLDNASSRIHRCGDVSGNDAWCQGCCDWYSCYTTSSRLMTSSTFKIELRYSSSVNDFAVCTYSGKTGHAVARVTLS